MMHVAISGYSEERTDDDSPCNKPKHAKWTMTPRTKRGLEIHETQSKHKRELWALGVLRKYVPRDQNLREQESQRTSKPAWC